MNGATHSLTGENMVKINCNVTPNNPLFDASAVKRRRSGFELVVPSVVGMKRAAEVIIRLVNAEFKRNHRQPIDIDVVGKSIPHNIKFAVAFILGDLNHQGKIRSLVIQEDEESNNRIAMPLYFINKTFTAKNTRPHKDQRVYCVRRSLEDRAHK